MFITNRGTAKQALKELASKGLIERCSEDEYMAPDGCEINISLDEIEFVDDNYISISFDKMESFEIETRGLRFEITIAANGCFFRRSF